MRQGDPSDRFYVLVRGRVEVTQGGQHLRDEGPGEFFGEIGLLRDVPRTATVTALEEVETVSLTREDFLGAVLGTDAVDGRGLRHRDRPPRLRAAERCLGIDAA